MHETKHARGILPAILLGLLLAAPAAAQKATEVFIPIGRSPGVSGIVTVIGTCTEVRPEERAVVVRGEGRAWTGTITAQTRIYLDRSGLGLPNMRGTIADLAGDREMEIKYCAGRRVDGGACEWIKVRVRTSRRE